MKRLKKLLLCLFFVFALHITLYTLHSCASVPHLINYQGRITDSAGAPLNGTYSITLRIYDAESAGNLLWQGTYNSILITKGIFNLLLGDVNDTGFNFTNLAFDKPYWLEIKVGSDEPMHPRQMITSTGYAIRAQDAENAKNADKVNNIQASVTPEANKLLPLDSNAKLPLTALKVYDSGWFAISANSTYALSHNLGTTKLLFTIYVAENSDGSGRCTLFNKLWNSKHSQTTLVELNKNALKIRTFEWVASIMDANGSSWDVDHGYCRVIALALE